MAEESVMEKVLRMNTSNDGVGTTTAATQTTPHKADIGNYVYWKQNVPIYYFLGYHSMFLLVFQF